MLKFGNFTSRPLANRSCLPSSLGLFSSPCSIPSSSMRSIMSGFYDNSKSLERRMKKNRLHDTKAQNNTVSIIASAMMSNNRRKYSKTFDDFDFEGVTVKGLDVSKLKGGEHPGEDGVASIFADIEAEKEERRKKREEIRRKYREQLKNLKQKNAEDLKEIDADSFLTNRNKFKKYAYAVRVFFHSRYVDRKPMRFIPKALVPRDTEEAFVMQKKYIEHAVSDPSVKLQGWKIGATSSDVMKKYNVTYPFVGAIFETNSYCSDGAITREFLKPWIPFAECEIGFKLNRDFNPVSDGPINRMEFEYENRPDTEFQNEELKMYLPATEHLGGKDQSKWNYSKKEIIESIEGIAPVIELVGSRMEDISINRYGVRVLQLDCGGNVALVHGNFISVEQYLQNCKDIAVKAENDHERIIELLKIQSAELFMNNKRMSKGKGSEVTIGWMPDGPIDSLCWLINFLTARGTKVSKGEIISSGTMTGKDLINMSSTKTIVGDFGETLGKVELKL